MSSYYISMTLLIFCVFCGILHILFLHCYHWNQGLLVEPLHFKCTYSCGVSVLFGVELRSEYHQESSPQPVPTPDKLWTTLSEQLTAMCNTCEACWHPTCQMTCMQIACMPCCLGKTRCSYSALHQACQDTILASGELQAVKGSKKASGKKGQDGKANKGEAKGVKATGKRKH